MPTRTRSSFESGFSLIELLLVMALAAILTALSITSLGGLRGGAQLNSSLSTLVGLLEAGRQRAIGANTYVWVLFASQIPGEAEPGIVVAVYERRDGSGMPTISGDVIDEAGEIWSPTLRTFALPHLTLKDKGEMSFPSLPAETSLVGLAPVSVAVTHAGQTINYSRAILFSPNGTARVSAALSHYLEFGLLTQNRANNGAVIRVNALTGKAQVYRP